MKTKKRKKVTKEQLIELTKKDMQENRKTDFINLRRKVLNLKQKVNDDLNKIRRVQTDLKEKEIKSLGALYILDLLLEEK